MNERIKELWENCDDIHVVYPRRGSPIYASPELLEKFAELIVRECAGVCEEYRGTKWGKAAECIGDSIKEHFGVES